MTEKEFYEDLLEKTKNVTIQPLYVVKDLSKLLRLLVIAQLTDENLKDLAFFSNEKPIKELLRNYNPTEIRRVGSYTDLLYEALDLFGEEKKSLAKKLSQAAYQAAKYLSKYQNLQDYEKKLYLACVDADTTLDYLNNFRKISSLSSMYFIKTCSFFAASGLLDIPVPESDVKEVIKAAFGIEDDNKLIYQKMQRIAKTNKVSCYELTQRILALHD